MTDRDQEPHYVTIGGNLIPVQPLNTLRFDPLYYICRHNLIRVTLSNFFVWFLIDLNCTHIIIDIHVIANQFESFHPYSADIQEAAVAGFGRGAGGQPHCE